MLLDKFEIHSPAGQVRFQISLAKVALDDAQSCAICHPDCNLSPGHKGKKHPRGGKKNSCAGWYVQCWLFKKGWQNKTPRCEVTRCMAEKYLTISL
jgi:hypothetical protein